MMSSTARGDLHELPAKPSILNRTRLNAYMKASRLDAVIAASAPNVNYATGYFYWADYVLKRWMLVSGENAEPAGARALLSTDGRVALVVPAVLAVPSPQLQVDEIYSFGRPPGAGSSNHQHHDSPMAALVAAIRDRGLDGGRVGIDADGMGLSEVAALRAQLARTSFLNCSNLWRLVRACKTEAEIELLVRSATIGEAAVKEALSHAANGVSCRELSRSFRQAVVNSDATFDHFMMGMADRGIVCEPVHDLRAGDTVFVDFGCQYGHAYADSGLTLSIPPHRPQTLDLYRRLHYAISVGFSELRPGNRVSTVFNRIATELHNSHVNEAEVQGHGVGLELRDFPIICPDEGRRIRDDCVDVPSDLEIERGMVINLETSYFGQGESFQIEQSVVVSEGRAQPLAIQDRAVPFGPQ